MRIGKDWAKGLTAATDPRIARAANAHRGLAYVRRTPREECKWPLSSSTTLPLAWSDDMAYLVGLTATDGCLVSGRRKINFKSNDRELVETYLRLLGRTNRVKEQRTPAGNVAYFTEFADTRLYGWLLSVGLMPRKSLRLAAIDVPDTYLFPLVRGLLDGDGSIQNFVHRPTPSTYPGYRYERLWVLFTSASRAHLDWLSARLTSALGVHGNIDVRPQRPGRNDLFRLKYGKHDSIALLRSLYPNGDVPMLKRKWQIWTDFEARTF
jgi:hypothetical protein